MLRFVGLGLERSRERGVLRDAAHASKVVASAIAALILRHIHRQATHHSSSSGP